MPVLLGLAAVLRYLIGFVPLMLSYIVLFFSKLITRTGLIALAFVTLIITTITTDSAYLLELSLNYLPPDFSHLMASILPDHFQACIVIIMSTRILVFYLI
ncbi:Head virion protein G6P [Arsenophonus sp.]|uniref:Head virion protein G6P n=1 Tax=Arsenophonus sp. TaxID=1872640 RepID=UPI00387965C7